MCRFRIGNSDDGWALVSVLWTIVILTMLAASVRFLTLSSTRLVKTSGVATFVDAAFDAGINRAVLGITDGRPDQRWRVDGATRNVSFGGITMAIRVQDELGRFDLNMMDRSMILRLLQSAGMELDQAQKLTDRILDWRSSSGLEHLEGVSDSDYASQGYSYHPRHGPFQSVDELKLVMGMTPSLFARIAPALTVYSQKPMIDPRIGTPEALRALYINSPAEVDSILADRARIGSDNVGAMQPGGTYSIALTSTIGSRRYKRYAVVRLTGDTKNPYLVLNWR